MEKVIEKYNEYIESYTDTWTNRFTWRDKKGDAKHSTSMVKFFQDTGIIYSLKRVNSIVEVFDQTNRLAGKYVSWVGKKSEEKGSPYSDAELNDMHNFFTGAIGEFFIVCLLTNMKCMLKHNVETKEVTRYDFENVAPLLRDDKDFGVDITCMVNDRPSVVQVKWWNPAVSECKEKLDANIFHKLVSEGLVKGYCRPEENDNRFLFWTGEEPKSTRLIKKMGYEDYCVDFGMMSMGDVINGRSKTFWDYFYEKLAVFCKTGD